MTNLRTAALQALAEPVQEPVAWASKRTLDRIKDFDGTIYANGGFDDAVPLYTAPPQRKPLTEEQRRNLVTNWFSEDWAIEQALGLLGDYDTVRAQGT